MPRPLPAPPTRRRLLQTAAGALALLLSGCDLRWAPGPETTPTAQPGPDDVALARAVSDARAVAATASALAAAGGEAAPVLAEAVDEARAHLRALGADPDAAADAPEADAPGADVPSGAGPGVPTAPAPPDTAAGTAPPPAERALADITAAAQRALDDAGGVSAGLARLLASIGTSRAVRAQQLALVTSLPVPQPPTLPEAVGTVPGPVPAAGGSSAAGTATGAAPRLPARELDALQAVLAGEHAAVHAFGLVAGRLPEERRPAASAALAEHRAARDALEALLLRSGAHPVPAAAGYDVEAWTPEEAVALAAEVEQRLADRYADLVAASTDLRPVALAGLLRAAAAATAWSGRTSAFPGIRELRTS